MDRDAMRARLADVIEERGFCVQPVHPVDGSAVQEWLCYAIGLTGLGHPEVVVHNLDPNTAMGLLNHLGERVMAGSRFDAGTVTTEVNRRGRPVAFVRVDDPADLTLVELVYGVVDAVQLVYPDRRGRFPLDAGCRVDRKMLQRLVGAPPTA